MDELPVHVSASPAPIDRLLDAALALAARDGWDAVHLHEAAREAGLTLVEAHGHCGGKDDLADAWFDRADRAMLRAADEDPHWQALSVRERLLRALLAWFEALDGQRAASIAMLRYRLQPDHLHLHAAGLMRISRTVQWWREAAWLPSTGWRREAEEIVLTAVFLGAVGTWWHDVSPGLQRTRDALERALRAADQAARWMGPAGLRGSA